MDKIKVVKSQLRLQQWAERISECQASFMIVSAWCDANDINIKTYYYWLRKVREVTVENLPVKAANLTTKIIYSMKNVRRNFIANCHFIMEKIIMF